MPCIYRTFPYSRSDTTPKGWHSSVIAGRVINHRSSVICLSTASEKVDHRKQHDLEYQADDEQLLKGAWFKPEDADVQIQLADVVEYPTRRKISDVHHRVD